MSYAIKAIRLNQLANEKKKNHTKTANALAKTRERWNSGKV